MNIHKSSVSRALAELQKGIDAEMQLPDPPQIGDVWLFASCDDDYGLAGYP